MAGIDSSTLEGSKSPLQTPISTTQQGEIIEPSKDVESDKKSKRRSKIWDELKTVILPSGESKEAQTIEKGQKELSLQPITEEEEAIGVSNFKYDREKSKRVLAKMIIVDEKPFKFVESKLFNLYSKTLQPRHEKWSRHTIRRECMKIHVEEREKIKKELKEVNLVCLTTDCWTSRRTKSYICLTCHYVSKTWKLEKRILAFRYFPPPHTGQAMANIVTEFIREWGLEGKVFTITVDNATANDSMLKILRESFLRSGTLHLSQIFHLRCSAHVLNLIVQFGLKHIEQLIKNVRESAKYVKSSSSRKQDFETSLAQFGLTGKKELLLDVQTRWNSTYLMLRAAKEVETAFAHYRDMDSNYKWCPSNEDWQNYAVVQDLLEKFYHATELISGSKYPTSNLFLPVMWRIKCALSGGKFGADQMNKLFHPNVTGGGLGDFDMDYYSAPNDQDEVEETFMEPVIKAMKEKFDKYWTECNLVLAIATILDPRYKLLMVKFCFAQIYQKTAGNELKKVRVALENIYELYEIKGKSFEPDEDSMHANSVSNCYNIFSDDAFNQFVQEAEKTNETSKSELDVYLSEKTEKVGNDVEFNVLDFWKNNATKYKILSIMAKDILSIPLTTVASESAFSTGERLISEHRSSLKSETVEALICAQDWLRLSTLQWKKVIMKKKKDNKLFKVCRIMTCNKVREANNKRIKS